ncbi:MAG: DUF1257 domain-containing protein [Blastocatellia bacterium]|nr:DUF1257 domain-containing protein [Blastocatellia bacterium]
MSKYLTFTEVVFKDQETLAIALTDIGCPTIREGIDLEMGRYYNEQTPQCANLIIPRQTFGNVYGDIGFQRQADQSLTPIIDDLDRSRVLNGQFIPKLRAAYHERVVNQVATRLRGTVQRVVEGGVIKLRVRY